MPSDLEIIKQYTKEEFQLAFVSVLLDVLKAFISLGASPELKVGKLKKFREPSILNQILPPAGPVFPQQNIFANLSGKMQRLVTGNINSKKHNRRMPEKEKEYGEDGLCSAWHFISQYPIKEIIDFIESLKIPIDEGNWVGDTPLMKIISIAHGDP